MANYFNIFAGLLTFIMGISLTYVLWTPVMDFINWFPTELSIFTGTFWVFLVFTIDTYMPFMMMISDDKG